MSAREAEGRQSWVAMRRGYAAACLRGCRMFSHPIDGVDAGRHVSCLPVRDGVGSVGIASMRGVSHGNRWTAASEFVAVDELLDP